MLLLLLACAAEPVNACYAACQTTYLSCPLTEAPMWQRGYTEERCIAECDYVDDIPGLTWTGEWSACVEDIAGDGDDATGCVSISPECGRSPCQWPMATCEDWYPG